MVLQRLLTANVQLWRVWLLKVYATIMPLSASNPYSNCFARPSWSDKQSYCKRDYRELSQKAVAPLDPAVVREPRGSGCDRTYNKALLDDTPVDTGCPPT